MSRTPRHRNEMPANWPWGWPSAGEWCRLADWLTPGRVSFAEPSAQNQRRERLRLTAFRLRRNYDALAGKQGFEELASTLEAAGTSRAAGEERFVEWVRLIEVFVQAAEVEVGAGRGEVKAARVKTAVLLYLRRRDIDLPRIPAVLEPAVFSLVVDASIDGIVFALNRYRMWTGAAAKAQRQAPGERLPKPRGGPVRRRVRGVLESVLHRLAWYLATPGEDLGSELSAEIERLAAAPRAGELLPAQLLAILGWLMSDRHRLYALIDLVALACQEAERLADAPSGAAKKAYARDLVLTLFYQNAGGLERSALLPSLLASTIDFLIEAVVGLFHERGVFSKGSREG